MTDTTASPRLPIAFGMGLVILVFGGGGYWMATKHWEAATVAPAVVAVESKRKSVQHLEGGIVGTLNVREGSVVREGDVVVRLDATRAEAQLAILRAQLDQGQAVEARLIAERDGAGRIGFPESLLRRQAEVAALLAGQEHIMATRRDMIAGETAILRQRIGQSRERAHGLEAQLKANAGQIRSLRAERESLRGLEERGYIKRTRIVALEREIARLEGEGATHRTDLALAAYRVEQAEVEIAQLERRFRQDVLTELAEVRSRDIETRERIIAAEDMLRRIDLRAPVSGIVVALDVHGPGAVIEPAQTLMEIVPENAPLVVEARIPTMHIDAIRIGRPATVRLTAVEKGRTPELRGRVETVSADRIASPEFGDHYRAHVVIDPAALGDIERGGFHVGMPAEVLIRSAARTPLEIVLQPFTDGIGRSAELWGSTVRLLTGAEEPARAAGVWERVPGGEMHVSGDSHGAPL